MTVNQALTTLPGLPRQLERGPLQPASRPDVTATMARGFAFMDGVAAGLAIGPTVTLDEVAQLLVTADADGGEALTAAQEVIAVAALVGNEIDRLRGHHVPDLDYGNDDTTMRELTLNFGRGVSAVMQLRQQDWLIAGTATSAGEAVLSLMLLVLDDLSDKVRDTTWEGVGQDLHRIRRHWHPNVRRAGRNDPCLCGSGNKAKRCCGTQ